MLAADKVFSMTSNQHSYYQMKKETIHGTWVDADGMVLSTGRLKVRPFGISRAIVDRHWKRRSPVRREDEEFLCFSSNDGRHFTCIDCEDCGTEFCGNISGRTFYRPGLIIGAIRIDDMEDKQVSEIILRSKDFVGFTLDRSSLVEFTTTEDEVTFSNYDRRLVCSAVIDEMSVEVLESREWNGIPAHMNLLHEAMVKVTFPRVQSFKEAVEALHTVRNVFAFMQAGPVCLDSAELCCQNDLYAFVYINMYRPADNPIYSVNKYHFMKGKLLKSSLEAFLGVNKSVAQAMCSLVRLLHTKGSFEEIVMRSIAIFESVDCAYESSGSRMPKREFKEAMNGLLEKLGKQNLTAQELSLVEIIKAGRSSMNKRSLKERLRMASKDLRLESNFVVHDQDIQLSLEDRMEENICIYADIRNAVAHHDYKKFQKMDLKMRHLEKAAMLADAQVCIKVLGDVVDEKFLQHRFGGGYFCE